MHQVSEMSERMIIGNRLLLQLFPPNRLLILELLFCWL